MKTRRFLVLLLAIILIGLGLVMTQRVFVGFRKSMLAQHEEMIIDIANSVDRSAQGHFYAYGEMLEYIIGRREFMEAEKLWFESGAEGELLFRMRGNLLVEDLQVHAILALRQGEVVLSTDGNTAYRLEYLSDEFALCFDEGGEPHFAILRYRPEMSYAAVVDLQSLVEYLASSSAVNKTDRMLLMDRTGQVAICYTGENTTVQVLAEEHTLSDQTYALMRGAIGSSVREAGSYAVEGATGKSTLGYALIGSGGSLNSCFVVCVVDEYDVYLAVLNRASVLFVICFGVLLAGLLLLAYYISALLKESTRTAKELEHLKKRQLALEEIDRQTKQVAHHQRLETIGTLTSSISHEFNNLLTPIMSYSLLTLEKLPPEEEELYDNVLEIYQASQKAKTIISRLSDLARKSTDKSYRMASVDELIKKMLDVALPAKPEGVEVKLDLNCWDQRIRVNEIQISQLMLNLILNAFDAMGACGTLRIHTTFDAESVWIRVADNGAGMPEDVRRHIFDPFFTTKDPGKGTGLGLAIAAQVVEDHKGTICAESEPGCGTTFTITLPRTEEPE